MKVLIKNYLLILIWIYKIVLFVLAYAAGGKDNAAISSFSTAAKDAILNVLQSGRQLQIFNGSICHKLKLSRNSQMLLIDNFKQTPLEW